MKGKLYKTDGTIKEIEPKDGKTFSLKELQAYVGGYIDVIQIDDDTIMFINDEGKLDGLEKNENATNIFMQAYPIEQYPLNNDQLVVGDVVVCPNNPNA